MNRFDAEASDIPEAAREAMGGRLKGPDRPHGEGESKAAKKRRKEKERREEEWKKQQQMNDIQTWHRWHNDSSSWRGPGKASGQGWKSDLLQVRKGAAGGMCGALL